MARLADAATDPPPIPITRIKVRSTVTFPLSSIYRSVTGFFIFLLPSLRHENGTV